MKIDLIAISYPNWEAFNSHIKESTGHFPTSGLGQTHIKENSAAAFLSCLDLRNQPLNQLRQGYKLHDAFYHFMMTFALTLDPPIILKVLSIFCYMRYIVRDDVIIMSGDMMEWHRCIVHGFAKDQDYEIRKLTHVLYTIFTDMGLKDLWMENKKDVAKDGTLIFL